MGWNVRTLTRFNQLNPLEKNKSLFLVQNMDQLRQWKNLKSLNFEEFEKKLKRNGVSIKKANLKKF